MNTVDRNNRTLPAELDGRYSFAWSVRIAATNGVLNSSTGWTYYEIPADAVLQRSRSSALDEGTWNLTLSILADALPELTEPLAYYQLEVDLVDSAGNAWPYHTGPIDSVSESWTLDNGGLVRVYEVQSFGVLQRTKGYDFNSLTFVPNRTQFAGTMTGIAQMHVVAMTGPFTAGVPVPIPGTNGGGTVDITVGTGSFPGVVVDNNSDFSSPAVYGAAADYTITNDTGATAPVSNQPAYLKFVANQVGTWYVKFWTVAYWGILKNPPGTRPFFIRVPAGAVTYQYGQTRLNRTIGDDFATFAAAGCTTNLIVVQDPEPFKNGTGVVAVTGGPTEYLEWTNIATGTAEVRQIVAVGGAGQISVSPFSAAPAAGDLIRLVTVECERAWERHNRNSGASQVSTNPGFYTSSGLGTAYPKGLFQLLPQSGVMRATQTRHWLTASTEVYANSVTYLPDLVTTIGNDNRLESGYSQLLVSTNLIASGDFETGNPLRAFIKNFSRTLSSIDQAIDDYGEDGLPPNGYLHDRCAGKVLVSAFRQKASPDCVLSNVLGVQIGALPEPVSKVTVRSIGEPRIITAELEPTIEGTWTNGQYLFDGIETGSLYAVAGANAAVVFRLRMLDGSIFPPISKIEIVGEQGVFEVYGERWDNSSTAIRSRQLEGFGYQPLKNGQTAVIEEQQLADMFASLGGFQTDELRVILKFYDDTLVSPALPARVYEIRAYSKIETGWSAYLTDDTTAGTGSYPSGWTTTNTEGFGGFYWVRNVGRARSFRYASTDYLKRVLPLYNASWSSSAYRQEIVDLTRINQAGCRQVAESYLDEYVRQGRTYTVTAMLDPRIDLGDTVSVTLMDGEPRDLFVWQIADSGGREDFATTYTLLDYAA